MNYDEIGPENINLKCSQFKAIVQILDQAEHHSPKAQSMLWILDRHVSAAATVCLLLCV